MQSTIICKIYAGEITAQAIISSVVKFCRSHTDTSINTAIIQSQTINPSTMSGRPLIEMTLTKQYPSFATELKASVEADAQGRKIWQADDYAEGGPQVTVAVTTGTIE